MRRLSYFLLLVSTCSGAVVLDRMAVIVGKHVIKESDIGRDLRVTDFLNNAPLAVNSQTKHQAAERLIDQQIIRDEIATGDYRRPPESDAAALLAQLLRDRFGGSEPRLRAALGSYGLTEEQLRDQLLWQLTVLKFIDQRFRVGVFVTDEDVRSYYDQHRPEFRREYPDTGFETLAPQVRSTLEGELVNKNFDDWLKQSRMRYRIEYRHGAFL